MKTPMTHRQLAEVIFRSVVGPQSKDHDLGDLITEPWIRAAHNVESALGVELMKEEVDDEWGFRVLHEEWFAKPDDEPRIMVGLYHHTADGQDAGTSGEFCVRWRPTLGPLVQSFPQLEAKRDGIAILRRMESRFKILDTLGLEEGITPRQTAKRLFAAGLVDLTERQRP